MKKLEEKLPQSVEHLHCMLEKKNDKSTTEKYVGASPLNPANSSVKFPDYSKFSFVTGQDLNDFIKVRSRRSGISHNKSSKH